MLAVIFGRGGGPEELGATFWGQTDLSCYDDSQHGIRGLRITSYGLLPE
jgi:hypothetical protein